MRNPEVPLQVNFPLVKQEFEIILLLALDANCSRQEHVQDTHVDTRQPITYIQPHPVVVYGTAGRNNTAFFELLF